ncbi:MAG: phospholipase effector Tle1 domain-containing protein [Gammaproteobacteria bacterium]
MLGTGWDTVESYGYLHPKSLPHTRHNYIVNGFGTPFQLTSIVNSLNQQRGVGAILIRSKDTQDPAGNDAQAQRETRRPRRQRVWFSGDHSDVGGGHENPNNHLANPPQVDDQRGRFFRLAYRQ